jgi:protein phosphatase
MTLDAVRCAFEDADVTWPGAMTDRPPPAPGLPQLVAAVERANVRVHAAASADDDKAGMGTTVTALLMLGDRVAVAHVGDSRLCRLRGRHLEQLTRDHTYVDRCVRAGIMTREQAAQSAHKHIITRAIGTDPEVKVDRGLLAIEPGDTFLLATDGLHGVVGDDDVAATLLAWPDLTRAATRLIEATLDAGAPDNISVVLVRVG